MPQPISMFASLARSFSSFSLKPPPPPPPPPSQRLSFDDHGTVGLGIVAAMVTNGDGSSRSEPILILPPANFMTKQDDDDGDHEQQKQEEEEEEEMMEIDEASESYTCVTSYVGGQAVSKTVYFGLDAAAAAPIKTTTANNNNNRNPVSNSRSKVDFYVSNSPLSSPDYGFPKDFLSRCSLCNKSLDGFGIFMYRGEKAFCSPECRYQYVLNDGHEHSDSCGSEVLMNFSDCSQSPCSSPLFSAGIAAA